jgi:quinoprotein relay system zinc metallohydrolase 2
MRAERPARNGRRAAGAGAIVRWHRRAARALGALALLSAGLLAARAAEPAEPPLQELAPGVWLRPGVVEDWGPSNQGRVANLGLVVGSRCAAVIDTGGTPGDGRAWKAAVERVARVPVCYVILTHAHPDHVLGNQAFEGAGADAPQFVGHARLPAALARRGPYYLNALRRDFRGPDAEARIVAPTITVDQERVLDLGDRRLRLTAWPTAHTDSDLTVLDEASGTLFLGDLLFLEHTPVVDGKLKGWLAALQQLRGWKVALAVPGHGAPSRDWPGALDAEQRYLTRLQADTRRAIKDGWTLSQTVERIGPDRPDWRLLDVFHKRNVTAAYAELEWDE